LHINFKPENENALMVSALHVKAKRTQSGNEKLVIPSAVYLDVCRVDEEADRKIYLVPLPENTIQR
jgi:hypothetical protein